jgi:hypothetical protein
MKLHVGNLAYQLTEDHLEDLFAEAGEVISAKVIADRMTAQPRGFGFVEMGTKREGQKAISMINGRMVEGCALAVKEAKPQQKGSSKGQIAMKVGKVVHYVNLSACKGVRVKRRGDPQYEEVRPEICFISLSCFTFEHDRPLCYHVGDNVDLQLDLRNQCHTFSSRVLWVVKRELWDTNYQYHTWFQCGVELELLPWLFQKLAGTAKRSWWSFKPIT